MGVLNWAMWREDRLPGRFGSNYGNGKSPRPGVLGPLANCHLWHINGGYQLLTNWDGPPNMPPKIS